MGVFKQGDNYRARFYRDGKSINVGTFKTKEEATVALHKARGTKSMKTKPNMRFEDFSIPFTKTTPKPSLWSRLTAWLRGE